MINNNLIRQLKERNLIVQITNEDILTSSLAKDPITLYCGFDPTADSLHLGHLIPLLCLRRFQKMGHRPIVLVGGATGLIGDPSFKSVERNFNYEETIQEWTNKISCQIEQFLDFNCGSNAAIIVNNYNWFGNMNLITFLRKIGKHFSVNQMINRESVKQRLNRHDQGISFTEFSYSLLQGYDFAYLSKLYNVKLQIGGSDQWGNILSGIDITRRLYQKQVFGLTIPLITKDDGTKLGKTENSTTIWLDPKKTSPYKFYQFWINTTDKDVYRFLKFFTFMDTLEIDMLEKEHTNINKINYAQRLLAEQVSHLVHGKDNLIAAKRITASLFKGTVNNLDEKDFKQLEQDGIPIVKIKKGADLIQVLVNSKLQPSRNQAYKIISSNAITINNKKQSNPEYVFTERDYLFGRYTLLCSGKKNYCLICWE